MEKTPNQVNYLWLRFKDTPAKIDAVISLTDDDSANLSLKARYAFAKNSYMVDMLGPFTVMFSSKAV